MRLGRLIASVWVASTCSNSEAPHPNASTPMPADRAGVTVRTAWVAPGAARPMLPSSGATTWEMASLGIAEIEQAGCPRRGGTRGAAGGAQERRAFRIGGVVAARPARDGVLLRPASWKVEIGPPHRPRLHRLELRERMRGVQVVVMAIDIDEVAPIGAPRDEMRLPDLVEQGLRHWHLLAIRRWHPALRAIQRPQWRIRRRLSTTACPACTGFRRARQWRSANLPRR